MPKSLEELLKIKKWTGKDAGLLYLYSTKNDILNARNETTEKFAITQEKFNTILKKISVSPKEFKEFNFYAKFQGMLMDVEKLGRFYSEQLSNHLGQLHNHFASFLTDLRIESKIKHFNISDEEKNSIYEELNGLFMLNMLLSNIDEPSGAAFKADFDNSYKIIIKNLAFFYSLNYVYDEIFKRYDMNFLDELKFVPIFVERQIHFINQNFEELLNLLSAEDAKKIKKLYVPIDYKKLIPSDDDIPPSEETEEKIKLSELEFITPEDIKTFILEISNIKTNQYLKKN